MTGRVVRLRKQELFRLLGYEPHPGQVEVHKSQALRRVLACGVRWGKSTCATMEAVAALLEPGECSIGWVVAPTYDLAERIFGAVVQLVQQKLSHRLLELDLRSRRIVVRSLSGGVAEMRAKSADTPTSLLGEGLDWLIVDEAARLREEVWANYLSQRLIDKKGWALFISTPKGPGWFYRMYRRGVRGEPGFASWCAPSYQNLVLDREVIEEERQRLLPEVFQQEYEAVFHGVELEPCEVCGGPSRDAAGIVLLNAGEELETCAQCEEPVNAEGRTLVRRGVKGKLELTVISLNPCADIGSPGNPMPVPPGSEFEEVAATEQ